MFLTMVTDFYVRFCIVAFSHDLVLSVLIFMPYSLEVFSKQSFNLKVYVHSHKGYLCHQQSTKEPLS